MLKGRFIGRLAYVWVPIGRFKRGLGGWGMGNTGGKRLQPGNRRIAEISDFILVRLRTQ